MSADDKAKEQLLSSICELEIGWAETTGERRYLHRELLACDEVRGVFPTARDDVRAVLFSGDRHHFHDWARTVAPPTPLDHHTLAGKRKGAVQ